MNILLINPSRTSPGKRITVRGGRHVRRWPPLSLLNCAALLERAGHNVRMIDAHTMTPPEAATRIRAAATSCDKIFVSSSDIDRWQCPDLDPDFLFTYTELLKGAEVYILGAHGTLYPDFMLAASGAQAVIMGEPELTVTALCNGRPLSSVGGIAYARDGKIHINPAPEPLDIATLPIPAYHHTQISDYYYELLGSNFALLETARGCPYHCTYCLKCMYGEGRRTKPVARVLNEIESLMAQGMKTLYFIDLNFTVDRNRIMSLCREMTARASTLKWCCQTRPDLVDEELLIAMKTAGCQLIHYGIESGVNDRLQSIQKQITVEKIAKGVHLTKKAGIETAGFFLMGLAGESDGDIEKTITFAKKLNMHYASLHIASPYRGTRFYDKYYRGHERFPESIHAGQALQDLKKTKKRFLMAYYRRPSYLFTHLFSINIGLTGKRIKLFLELLKQS